MSSLLGFLRRGGKKSSGGVRRRGSGILTRNRSHVLNIKNLSPGGSTGSAPELLWQEKEKEEKMMSECRMVRANRSATHGERIEAAQRPNAAASSSTAEDTQGESSCIGTGFIPDWTE